MIRVHHRAAFERLHHAYDFRTAALHGHLGAGCHVTAFFKTQHQSVATSRTVLELSPTELLRGRLEDSSLPLVLEVLQAELQRIHVHSMRELVDMAFAREVVGGRRKPAVRALAQRRVRRMKYGTLVRKIVSALHAGRAGVIVMKLPSSNRAVLAHAA